MKFRILFLISSISVLMIAMTSRPVAQDRLLLRQKIQLLENNALRNILSEKNFFKRSLILEAAIDEISKIREQSPQQLKKDEKVMSSIVKNLKALSSQNQALYKGVP